MRLDEGVIRELHWHKEAEWAYVLEGEVRITGIDYEGGNFIDDLKKGDLWYFPSGVPHSLQGLGENGTEFLLIFDNGSFSEESTFVLTDWLGELALPVVCLFPMLGFSLTNTRFDSPHTQVGHLQELPPGARSVRHAAQEREVHLPGLRAGPH
jgi:oxalate decarboxylase family bicupin protein